MQNDATNEWSNKPPLKKRREKQRYTVDKSDNQKQEKVRISVRILE